jgi:23S rRNA pseudouridine2605 synthase
VLEHLGLKVNRLIRVSFGPFQLGEIPEGAVEEVRTRHLREQLGERIAKEAEVDFAGPIAIAGDTPEDRSAAKARVRSEPKGQEAEAKPKGKTRKLRERFRTSERSATGRAKRGQRGGRPRRKH